MNVDVADKIDILLAVYNGDKYLSEQLRSVLDQDYVNFRIIVHDDGSTDGSVRILDQYRKKYPYKFLIVEDDYVFGSARDNFFHLIKHSDAPYVAFCDQDDFWLPDKLKTSLEELKSIEAGSKDVPAFVHSDLEVCDSELKTISSSFKEFQKLPDNSSFEKSLYRNNVTGCTVLANRACFINMDGSSDAVMHDWWLSIKVRFEGGRVKYIQRPLVKYRQHGVNAVGAKKFGFLYIINNLIFPFSWFRRVRLIYKQALFFKKIPFVVFLTKKFLFFLLL